MTLPWTVRTGHHHHTVFGEPKADADWHAVERQPRPSLSDLLSLRTPLPVLL